MSRQGRPGPAIRASPTFIPGTVARPAARRRSGSGRSRRARSTRTNTRARDEIHGRSIDRPVFRRRRRAERGRRSGRSGRAAARAPADAAAQQRARVARSAIGGARRNRGDRPRDERPHPADPEASRPAGGELIALSLLALAGFYRWRGSIEVHDKPTGRLIRRFSPAERIAHWSVAISFSVLGITGLVMGLGKYVLLPVFGHTLFAWLADGSKALHNFTGPVFAVFLPILIAIFIRDNLPKAYNLGWLKTFGGMLSRKGSDAPSGRFNAGEKILFWVLPCFLSVILVVTGRILDFPNFDQTRRVMQQANLLHLI